VEESGFERAAQRLNITQSAVSQRLRALEAQVGTVLIVRSRPLKATAAGLLLLKHTKQMRLLRADLERDLKELAPSSTGSGREEERILIAINADSIATWALGALGDLARQGLPMEIITDDQDFTHEWLRSGQVLGCVTTLKQPLRGCKLVPLGADGKEVVASAASVVLSVKEAIATAIAALPKINLPKINLPALPVLAGVASTIEGTGDPNTKYNVYDGDKVIGTVTTDASGKWKFELPKLSAGDHSIKLVPLGADGKEVVASAASVVLSVKEAIATAIAALPKINPPKINVPGVNGAVTAVKPGVLDGTGDPNTKYTIYDGDKAIGTVTTDASGKWKFEMPDLAVGNHVIKLVPMGADGKEVPASAASVNVSATAAAAPAAIVPSITPLKGDTVSQGGIIRGKGEPGSTVAIYDGDKEVGTAKVDAKGNWEWKVPLDYALGDHNLKVATKGADGKLGAFSPVYKVKVIGPVTLPVTGDESPAQPIWVMALLALGALAVGVSARKLNTTRR
ncbi:MAG TPA: Ig-like domain-containing protein, partial [Thermoflexales bacterium]|nr:Ig-like domain-containing protein [Thermoflexales bacterium]